MKSQSRTIHSTALRRLFLEFFATREHAVIPSAPLVPQNDSSTLFVSSGMQPLIPYLLGQAHPSGNRIVNLQKSFRSQDIEEVGDNRHTTFFEMMGNWSFGSYFKKEQLPWFFEFLTEVLQIDPNKLYVTVFLGNDQVDEDQLSVKIWQEIFKKHGMKARYVRDAETNGMQGGRIFGYGEKKNWWSRSGVPSAMPAGEPGGPDSEVFFDFGAELQMHEQSEWKDLPCHVNCDCGRFIEIGNSVFMEYVKDEDGGFRKLKQQNMDFGGGFERILAVLNQSPDVFLTDVFSPIIIALETISGKKYTDLQSSFRVIADHIRASVILIGDGVEPSNKAQGYVLRRLLRRSIRHGRLLGVERAFLGDLVEPVIKIFEDAYPELGVQQARIMSVVEQEEQKFLKTIKKGLAELEKMQELTGESAFFLYETYGFPFELTEELAREKGQTVEFGAFRSAFEKHQEASRSASKGMFKGGLADHSEITTKYHTATHLLHSALRLVLGDHVQQEGSNITAERLRFDFRHPRALTDEEKKQVEEWINLQITSALPVTHTTMSKEQALAQGALAFFREKYPEDVSVYTIENPNTKQRVSMELCGGPHVQNTSEIGKIVISKEESVGSGKRRIYLKLA